MSENSIPKRQRAPVSVLTYLDAASESDEAIDFKDVPAVTMHLLISLDELRRMVAAAEKGEPAFLEWNVRTPATKLIIETRDPILTGISKTEYGEAATRNDVVMLHVGLV